MFSNYVVTLIKQGLSPLTSLILPPDDDSFHRRRFVDERSALAWAHKFVQDFEQELTSP
ncbi:hypothetical protein [Alteromonas gracilis]|uniref:hypothetical protein n=1 Tax=Alteromonas gracilis TaxID=1479524 RepID=UPI0030CDBF10